MRNFNDDEYLKIFRKMVFWEWYTDVNTKVLFLHCLIMANWKPGRWKGISYERGQFITSLESLSKETGLTVQQVRTSLQHLIATGELTSKSTNKNRIITVVSFDRYQGEQQAEWQANNKQNNNQSTNNQQAANNRYKNINNIKNNKNNIPSLPPGGVAPDEYGPLPEGWTAEDEAGFLEDAPDNPGKTRQDWWDFWKG